MRKLSGGQLKLASNPDVATQVSAYAWLAMVPIMIQAGPFSFEGREYQKDWFKEDHPDQRFIKGAQTGATTANVLNTIHGMKANNYPQGAMYLFPTGNDVSDFSKSQFKPMIEENREIARYVQSTDSETVKRINRAMLYLRGARATAKHGSKQTSTRLKTAAVDLLVFDEYDEMAKAMIKLAEARTGASKVADPRVDFPGHRRKLSTPTIPDYGIDKDYQASDGRVWMLKCDKCGRYTCLELEFPSCLARRGIRDNMPATALQSHAQKSGHVVPIRPDVYRICTKCRDAEVYPRNGIWVPQRPQITDAVGWWISQLNTVTMNPANILNQFENPDDDAALSEVHNSMLGKAYIQAENRLTENQVYDRCSRDPMAGYHSGPNGMGVDVGKILNVVIGHRPYGGRMVKIIKMCEVSSFDDVYDLEKRYGVKHTVFDLNPEQRAVRAYAASTPNPVHGCYYNENQHGAYAWNEKNGTVMVNRTEICDTTHDLIADPGACELPRRDADVEKYAKQMCNIAKVLIEDDESGSRVYRYRKLGDEHYRHATNYLYLALERMPIMSVGRQTDSSRSDDDFYFD